MKLENNATKESKKITSALLMAAGMGTRIRPISENTPKPLIPVNGTPMIETNIQGLINAGIEEIIISVGYKKEKYYYLKEKYGNITFVENTEYTSKNTISSFYAARDYIRDKNCIVSESDLYIADPSLLQGEMDKSRYLLRKVEPQNYEWGFHMEEDQIKKVVRPIPDVYLDHHMYGVAYWMREDVNKLIDAVEEAYKHPGHEQKAYDEIANEIFDKIDMGYIEVKDGQIYEVDCLEDLLKVDSSYDIYIDK